MNKLKVGIIGGGIAGSSVALYLSKLGIDVTLFEKSKSLVNGPPICHLHAGGNLYREISDKQCLTLLKESIELIQLYPQAIDYRPTVVAVPLEDSGSPKELIRRLVLLQGEYQKLILKDSKNKVLGDATEYFKLFSRDDLESLKLKELVKTPRDLEEWMIPVAKNLDLEKLQFPVIMVQEYGINLFRLAAVVSLELAGSSYAKVLTQTSVKAIVKKESSYEVKYREGSIEKTQEFRYIVNAAGFKSGEIDDMLGFSRERLVEFKAAYVTKCESFSEGWPEVIFYGERGTPNGMAQFTPYPNGYFQLHGMTNSITLFDQGLVKSTQYSSQPQLEKKFLNKIYKGWSLGDIESRTAAAIDHLAQYIPIFKNAKMMSKPLFGAQQIPGEDATLRAANVSFEGTNYARCEIVKASSVLTMADAITQKLIKFKYLDASIYRGRVSKHNLNESEIVALAEKFAQERFYPISLAGRCFSKN